MKLHTEHWYGYEYNSLHQVPASCVCPTAPSLTVVRSTLCKGTVFFFYVQVFILTISQWAVGACLVKSNPARGRLLKAHRWISLSVRRDGDWQIWLQWGMKTSLNCRGCAGYVLSRTTSDCSCHAKSLTEAAHLQWDKTPKYGNWSHVWLVSSSSLFITSSFIFRQWAVL